MPIGTVRLDGMASTELLLERETTTGAAVGATVNVTVQVADRPEPTEVGLQSIELRVGRHRICTVLVSEPVLRVAVITADTSEVTVLARATNVAVLDPWVMTTVVGTVSAA